MSEELTSNIADIDTLDLIFNDARTHNSWQDRPVSEELLRQVYDLAKWGPTSANTSPMRIVFLNSPESKARLLPTLAPNNVHKSESAPVIAVIAWDTEFYEKLSVLYPQVDAKSWFVGNDSLISDTAFRNSSLQGAYFIIAARALGLDCGPMSGFDPGAVNNEFFPDGKYKVNFIVNLGYGDTAGLHPRNPRLDFDDAAEIL